MLQRLSLYVLPLSICPAGAEDMLNRIPWDLIYQEWWGEYPPQDRTDYVGLYRTSAAQAITVTCLSLSHELVGSKCGCGTSE